MDNTREFTTVEWCAGYGGIQLGLRRVIPNLRAVAYSEIEAFACANLVAKMEAGQLDAAPIWTDIKTFPCQEFRDRVDLLVAGYPCQPFSAAGKRQGADDPRHLWPFIRKAIGIVRPKFCFFENVEGHISLGLSTVISDLEEDGYRTTWGIFSAEEVGAPHRRKRVFILAHKSSTRLEGARGTSVERFNSGSTLSGDKVWPSRPGEPQHEWEPPRVLADKHSNRCDEGWECVTEAKSNGVVGEDGRQVEPSLGGDADGFIDRLGDAELCESCDNRTDELRLLGNGVVPATAELAWRVLYQRLNGRR